MNPRLRGNNGPTSLRDSHAGIPANSGPQHMTPKPGKES
jgi:hypothetical protein